MSDSSDDHTSSYDSDSSSDDSNEAVDFTGVMMMDGKYVLVAKIGHGAFSTVWLAYNTQSKKFNAIKIQDADEFDSGMNEVDILLKINKANCQHLNKLVDKFVFESVEGEHVCMVFELLAGSVFDLIRTGKYSNGLPLNLVKNIIRQSLLAIDSLNTELNLLHTDIKPENLLLVGTSYRVQSIIDQFNKLNNDRPSKKSKKKKAPKTSLADMISKISIPENPKNNNDKKNRNDTTQILIDEKYYLESIDIRLSDFAGCHEISSSMVNEIQTRYYMAPEIILDHPFNENCDVWSIGCMTYELLTGKLLFDPGKDKRFNRDRCHLYDIQCTLGLIPDKVIQESKKKSLFFRKNGLLKGTDHITYRPLSVSIIKKLGDTVDPKELSDIIDFIYMTLEIDPEKRPFAKDCLKHRWLN
jgi:serine/threonine-protein kinase SRPK3